jgi:hypothetical protein
MGGNPEVLLTPNWWGPLGKNILIQTMPMKHMTDINILLERPLRHLSAITGLTPIKFCYYLPS